MVITIEILYVCILVLLICLVAMHNSLASQSGPCFTALELSKLTEC